MRALLVVLATLLATPVAAAPQAARLAAPETRSDLVRVNIIDGEDGRDSLVRLGPSLGLSAADVARIRMVSGYVGCLSPSPSVGSAALFLENRQILTAAHVFFEPSGKRRWKCFFKNQAADPVMIDLLVDDANARFGAKKPRPGSNNDYAVVRLATPLEGAVPFPVMADVPVKAGEKLIVVTAHPADMAREIDRGMPVVQGCTVRRKPVSTEKTSFFRTDCDATGASSGGMNLARINGTLAFRGITITTGPWRDPDLFGAPYNEKGGSVTTALGTDAAVLAAGRSLAGDGD